MSNPTPYPELGYQQWRALSLVNEKVYATAEKICHHLYGNQTALVRTEELLNSLWDLGLVTNMGHFENYRWITTEAGDDYIDNAIKPTKEPRFKCRQS